MRKLIAFTLLAFIALLIAGCNNSLKEQGFYNTPVLIIDNNATEKQVQEILDDGNICIDMTTRKECVTRREITSLLKSGNLAIDLRSDIYFVTTIGRKYQYNTMDPQLNKIVKHVGYISHNRSDNSITIFENDNIFSL